MEPDRLLITAFDPNKVQKELYPIKIVKSIADISPDKLTEPVKFTEKETERALMMEGVTADDLVKASQQDRQAIPGTPKIKARILADLEKRRLETYQRVLAARNKLIQEKKEKAKSEEIVLKSVDKKSFDKLKAKKLATFLAQKDAQEASTKHNEIIDKRLAKRKRQRQKEIFEKQETEAAKLTQKLRNMREQSTVAMNPKEEKLERMRKMAREKELANIADLEDKIQNVPKGQANALKKKQKELDDARSLHERNEAEFKEKLSRLRNSDIGKEESDVPNRSRFYQDKVKHNRRIQSMLVVKMKEEREKQEQVKLERMLKEREERIQENLRTRNLEKQQRIKANSLQMKKRSRSAMEAVQMQAQKRREAFEVTLQKQKEAEVRASKIKAKRGIEMQERAGETWLRHKKGADNAKRIRLLKEYEVITKAEKTQEKLEQLQEVKRMKEKLFTENLRKTELAKLKVREEFDELERVIKENPDVDPVELAREFHVSMKSVKKLVKSMS